MFTQREPILHCAILHTHGAIGIIKNGAAKVHHPFASYSAPTPEEVESEKAKIEVLKRDHSEKALDKAVDWVCEQIKSADNVGLNIEANFGATNEDNITFTTKLLAKIVSNQYQDKIAYMTIHGGGASGNISDVAKAAIAQVMNKDKIITITDLINRFPKKAEKKLAPEAKIEKPAAEAPEPSLDNNDQKLEAIPATRTLSDETTPGKHTTPRTTARTLVGQSPKKESRPLSNQSPKKEPRPLSHHAILAGLEIKASAAKATPSADVSSPGSTSTEASNLTSPSSASGSGLTSPSSISGASQASGSDLLSPSSVSSEDSSRPKKR